jgi:ADP-heptose:LPS heptosyltransferase
VVDLELFSRFTGLLTGLSGANRRIGFHRFYGEGLYRGDMLTHRVAYNPHIHIAKNFIALVDSLLSAVPTVPYSKTVIDDQQLIVPVRSLNASACDKVKAQIKALVSRLLMVCPSVSEKIPQRRWMPERYLELIQQILATHDDVLVLIMGASSERAEAEELAAQCASDRCITLAGCTTITDLRALYSLAVAMVTNDSGPAHFAAASGLPTIVLFGPETPNLYRPLGNAIVIYAGLACSPCVSANNHRKSACDDNVCMRAISVEQVFKVVNTVLTANSRVCLI